MTKQKMKTRAAEKFKIQNANRERFKNTSIIALQKRMNHDASIYK